MNPLSSELPFHVHNWLIISLKDFCIVIKKWPSSNSDLFSGIYQNYNLYLRLFKVLSKTKSLLL